MKRLIFLALLFAGLVARATDYPVQLSVELVKPSGQSYLNLESCQNPQEVELEISWKLTANPLWIDTQNADIFLAADNTCSSAQVEIGKAAGQGVDTTIRVGQTQGSFPQSGDKLLLSQVTGLDCNSQSERDYYFCIKWTYEENVGLYTNKYIYRGGAKLRFDTKKPAAPELTQLSPGEGNLKVTWEKPADDDLASYFIYYRREGSSDIHSARVTTPEATSRQITGLENGVSYEVWMTAVDKAENESGESNHLTSTPQPVEDFYEHYRSSGGQEDGGFCFVATAAWGNYHHPWVESLRRFRDQVLQPSPTGRELVRHYYLIGPRFARAIEKSEPLRALARALLTPAVWLAEAWMKLGAGGLAFALAAAALAVALLRRKKKPAQGKFFAALVITLALTSFSRPAAAGDFKPTSLELVEPQYQFQARFGFYRPAIDSEAGLSGKPFGEIFGNSSRFLFELALDWEFLHLWGPLSAGGSAGFVQYLGKALTADGQKTSDTNVFNLLPLRLNVSYTFDRLYSWLSLPFMPYVSGGLDYFIWWVLDGVGNVASFTDAEGHKSSARGGIFGAHFSVGLKLLLDALDREAAGNLQTSAGIINSYLFVEYNFNWVDGLGVGSHFDLSDDLVMFGLAMEF